MWPQIYINTDIHWSIAWTSRDWTEFKDVSVWLLGNGGMVSSRKSASPRFGVQMLECSNLGKRRRRMDPWWPGRIWITAQREWGRPQCGRGRWKMALSPWLPAHSVRQATRTYTGTVTVVTPEASTEKGANETEQWTLHTAVAIASLYWKGQERIIGSVPCWKGQWNLGHRKAMG